MMVIVASSLVHRTEKRLFVTVLIRTITMLTHEDTHMNVHARMHVSTDTCIQAYTCMCTHTHTHTHCSQQNDDFCVLDLVLLMLYVMFRRLSDVLYWSEFVFMYMFKCYWVYIIYMNIYVYVYTSRVCVYVCVCISVYTRERERER